MFEVKESAYKWKPGATKSKYGETLKVLHFDTAPYQGHGMSMKYEQPLDELIVQVWLLYHHPNFILHFVCKRERITGRRTDKKKTKNNQTDERSIRLQDAPCGPFRTGA